ncbi:LysM peptidoglycan-binding domain-containing protein [Cohnella lubricantis]|uniref:LysM peptidoglycan-binding domain-containing protein n=1 Tax=Cohnella lubricantis TaxID=2163172 RepID=A0A841TL13_9BACL|nr:LysM peptidoglycan-binding domain-containing protein [Cohnella lubricantis]MBB6679627.1 LysM peptidoglycan-binding domain-containing protein [Cohnella lubricantis]MBP2118599.1 hypothetical protein [Cohnella lubricantis]
MVHTWVLSSNGQAGRLANAAIDRNRNNRFSATSGRQRQTADISAAGWKLLRVLIFAIVFLILFTGLTLMRTSADGSVTPSVTAEEKVVFADTGDTLWGIAEDVKRDGLDTRDAIHRIMERNGLTSSSLRSGDELIIPSSVLEP